MNRNTENFIHWVAVGFVAGYLIFTIINLL